MIEGDFSSHLSNGGVLTITPVARNPASYFFLMNEERIIEVMRWIEEAVPRNSCEKRFCKVVNDALDWYSTPFAISTIEPSIMTIDSISKVDSLDNKRIYLSPNNPITTGLTFSDWQYLCREFLPIYTSMMANTFEITLFYAYRIAMGYWSLSLVGGTGHMGNYKLSLSRSDKLELSASQQVGGFRDGIGNTYVITQDLNGNPRSMGGCYNSYNSERPIGEIMDLNLGHPHHFGTPKISLKSPPVVRVNGTLLPLIDV